MSEIKTDHLGQYLCLGITCWVPLAIDRVKRILINLSLDSRRLVELLIIEELDLGAGIISHLF